MARCIYLASFLTIRSINFVIAIYLCIAICIATCIELTYAKNNAVNNAHDDIKGKVNKKIALHDEFTQDYIEAMKAWYAYSGSNMTDQKIISNAIDIFHKNYVKYIENPKYELFSRESYKIYQYILARDYRNTPCNLLNTAQSIYIFQKHTYNPMSVILWGNMNIANCLFYRSPVPYFQSNLFPMALNMLNRVHAYAKANNAYHYLLDIETKIAYIKSAIFFNALVKVRAMTKIGAYQGALKSANDMLRMARGDQHISYAPFIQELIYHVIISFFNLNMMDQAKLYLSLLYANYPHSKYYTMGYQLVMSYNK